MQPLQVVCRAKTPVLSTLRQTERNYNMDRYEISYSSKDIPTPSNESYKRSLLQKTEDVVRRLRWKALILDTDSENTPSDFILKINFQKFLNMVPVLLSSTQISQLLKKLEAFGDQSLQVRRVILLEKRYPVEQFQVWVDVWPEFTTILLKQKLSEIHTYYMFTLVKENLKKFLQITDIVEWENATFRMYPYDLHQILKDVANKRGFRVMYAGFIFCLYKVNAIKLKQRPVPEDVTVGSLTLDMADRVVKNWYGACLYQDKTLFLVKYLINTYPSVCVYDSKGTPVAYEIGQEHGGLGMLFVDPAYRKRGFGKLVTNLLVQKYVDLGYQPFVYIDNNNDVSIKLHVNMGFEKSDIICEVAKVVTN